jgi:hypothetical protein
MLAVSLVGCHRVFALRSPPFRFSYVVLRSYVVAENTGLEYYNLEVGVPGLSWIVLLSGSVLSPVNLPWNIPLV